jgi:hypothetical protein
VSLAVRWLDATGTICYMQQREYQKYIERKHLELFLDLHVGSSPTDVAFDDNPDLLMSISGKPIGVEHTQYFIGYRGPSGLAPKAQETLQSKIVWKAWQEYKETHKQPLWVLVVFEQATNYYGNDVDTTAQSLAAHIAQLVSASLTIDTWYKFKSWRARRSGLSWPRCITEIHIQVLSDASYEMWGPSQSYVVPHLTTGELQSVIDTKNERVANYRRKCEEVWLVIVIDDGSQSSHFDVDDTLLNHEFVTNFDKLFLLRRFHRELYDLRRSEGQRTKRCT